MIDIDLSLQKPLEDYIEAFAKQTPRSIMLFENIVDEGFIFQDPYRRAQGFGGLSDILLARFKLYESSRYKVYDFLWGRRERTAYMYWSYIFEVQKKHLIKTEKTLYSIEGMCELVFSGDKKILSHTDFWGAHDAFDVKSYQDIRCVP